MKSNLPANADEDTKKASARQTLKFLQSKHVTVGGDTFINGPRNKPANWRQMLQKEEASRSRGESSGADKTFKEYVVAAIKAKKMSKDDFNKAIDVHCGPKASKEDRKAAGEKTLKFLQDKGVKVG